jgi:phosphoglycerate kinase
MIEKSKELLSIGGKKLLIATDALVAKSFADEENPITVDQGTVIEGMGLDVGPKSIADFKEILTKASTVF